MQVRYRMLTYALGDYMDVQIFPTYRKAGARRGKFRPTGETQRRLNQRNREKKLIRLMHANFTDSDYALHLTYRDGAHPADEREALRHGQNYLRRVKRRRAKLGLAPLRYIMAIEKSKKGRYHLHLTISGGMARDELEELWEHGRANSRRLQFDEYGICSLAVYVSKQPALQKAWCASRNLVMPAPAEQTITKKQATAIACETAGGQKQKLEALFEGYEAVEVTPYGDLEGGGVYLGAWLATQAVSQRGRRPGAGGKRGPR